MTGSIIFGTDGIRGRVDSFVMSCVSNVGTIDSLKELGITALTSGVGDHNVAKKMNGATVGGELSVHIIFKSNNYTSDALFPATGVMRGLSEKQCCLQDLVAKFNPTTQYSINVNVVQKISLTDNRNICSAIQSANNSEGCRKVIVRYSGIEHVCSVLIKCDNVSSLKQPTMHISEQIEKHNNM